MGGALLSAGHDHEHQFDRLIIGGLVIGDPVGTDRKRHTGVVDIFKTDMRNGDSISDPGAHQAFPVKDSPCQIVVRDHAVNLRQPVDQRVEHFVFCQVSVQNENPIAEERTDGDLFRVTSHYSFLFSENDLQFSEIYHDF